MKMMWGYLLYSPYGPLPEFHRHHVGHVAPEAVDSLAGPVHENVEHFSPSARCGDKVLAPVPRVDAVVEFHCFIPVASSRCGVVAIVARSLGRILDIPVGPDAHVDTWCKVLPSDVKEIVGRREKHVFVVVGPQVSHALGCSIAVVLTRNMVGHKVDNHAHASLVCALHQLLKLVAAVGHIDGKVGVNIVIVSYGIGRARIAFHHVRVARRDAVGAVIGLGGMFDDSGIPQVGHSELANRSQHFVVDVVEFPHSVLVYGAVVDVAAACVGEKAGQELINDDFICVHLLVVSVWVSLRELSSRQSSLLLHYRPFF